VSPTQRSLKHLRDEGWTATVVEHWNPWSRRRQDLFGILDILALRGADTLGVQTTTLSHMGARLQKMAESPLIGKLRDAGWLVHCHGWRKLKSGWEVKIEDIS
jgi:hypothetical protein